MEGAQQSSVFHTLLHNFEPPHNMTIRYHFLIDIIFTYRQTHFYQSHCSIWNTVKALTAELLQQCSFIDTYLDSITNWKYAFLVPYCWCFESELFVKHPSSIPQNYHTMDFSQGHKRWEYTVGEFRLHWFVCIRHWNAAGMNAHRISYAYEASHNSNIWAFCINGLPSFKKK